MRQYVSSAPEPDRLCALSRPEEWAPTLLRAAAKSGAYFNSSSSSLCTRRCLSGAALASVVDLQNAAAEVLAAEIDSDRRRLMGMAIAICPTLLGFSYGTMSAAYTLQATVQFSSLVGMMGSLCIGAALPWLIAALGAFL